MQSVANQRTEHRTAIYRDVHAALHGQACARSNCKRHCKARQKLTIKLALDPLERLACFCFAWLFPFNNPRIPCEQSLCLQRGPELWIK